MTAAGRRRRFYLRFETWDLIALPAVKAALRLDPERRRMEVARLVDELVAIGVRPRDDRAVADPVRAAGEAEVASRR